MAGSYSLRQLGTRGPIAKGASSSLHRWEAGRPVALLGVASGAVAGDHPPIAVADSIRATMSGRDAELVAIRPRPSGPAGLPSSTWVTT